MISYIIFALLLYVVSYVIYVRLSKGLGHKAEYLQLRRFVPCAILPALVMWLANVSFAAPAFFTSMVTGAAWIISYPLCYYLTNHKASSDFGFHLDTVFGMYIIAWLMSLKILALQLDVASGILLFAISVIEFVVLAIPVLQLAYYALYKTCIDLGAVSLVLQTYLAETIEFFYSLPLSTRLLAPLVTVGSFGVIAYSNWAFVAGKAPNLYEILAMGAIMLFLTIYLWNTKKGVFIRTGIVELFLDVKDYLQQNLSYKTNMEQRIASLIVNAKISNKPHTHILVIGESASRDYMGAFGYEKDTTPWLSALSKTANCIIFPHAYSCKCQTVPSLERALTEVNQYNDLKFYEACSFVDIVRKLGYKISWFSNQSHIGSADTPITLMANTADVAEWTKLHLEQVQYDETLLDYVKKVDPNENNFIVIHLKGSHFNFINRYPHDFATFSEAGKYDLIPNYLDTIKYTDYVLKNIYEYAEQHLNLQSMIYFSDHACVPDKRRSPNFEGFALVRIPLAVWLSDQYIADHAEVLDALKDNSQKYWTNDLAYELICGVLDVESNRYDKSNGLASKAYKWKREELKTNLGTENIVSDKTED